MSGPPPCLAVLPVRDDDAAGNMAADLLLLRHAAPGACWLRHYGWRTAAFTFGLGQKLDWVRGRLPPGPGWDLCRRPTGGGIVDHRDDWTYALVLPRGHPWCEGDPREAYRLVHESLADALRELGVPAGLQPPPADPAAPAAPTVCFERPETWDVIRPADGRKLAGAAQKRDRHGLLLQGSVDAAAAAHPDREALLDAFTARLAASLSLPAVPHPGPDLPDGALDDARDHFASPAWLARR